MSESESFTSRIETARELLEASAGTGELRPQAEATLQEALEFLIRLESMIDEDRAFDGDPDGVDRDEEDEEAPAYDLEATFEPEEWPSGSFDVDEVVVFDPDDAGEDGWIAAPYGETVPFENVR